MCAKTPQYWELFSKANGMTGTVLNLGAASQGLGPHMDGGVSGIDSISDGEKSQNAVHHSCSC